MGPRRIAMLLTLAAGPACAQPASPPPVPAPTNATPPQTRRIFLPPPLQWDSEMLSYRPALQQTAADFANLTGGLAFGMSPTQINAKLAEPYPGMSWGALTLANEYPGEVRYFGVPIAAAGKLRMDVTACTGAGSYIVFLFSTTGLFRLSYRLLTDKTCDDTNDAAQQIFGRYVPLAQSVAGSVRYRAGRTQVVDITDPSAGYLTPIRWRQGFN